MSLDRVPPKAEVSAIDFRFPAKSGLNHRTGTTTACIRKADIRVRFARSAHQISN
ncbi:MAG: hypothetical protein IIB63_09500 [Proteobacteria bacterium]|nr:hypothetical protein [Pseudomonadota bacterium]